MNFADSSPGSAAVKEAAARWAVRLEGEALSAEERGALNDWLEAAPEHRAELSRFCQFSADLERQLPELVAAGAFGLETEPAGDARRGWRRGAAVLAGLAATLALTWLIWPRERWPEQVVAPGHRQTLSLADGSQADLNAITSLKVDFSSSDRRVVQLDRGEAVFRVAKNPARPFLVETPGGRVRVTGTTFQVRVQSSGRLEVAVVEGSVEVQPRASAVTAAPLRLEAGDQVALDHSRVEVRRGQADLNAQVAAWREGWVVFDRAPLADVLRRFADFHDRTISVDPAVASERISGRFGLDDLEGFLFADLERALPSVRVERDTAGAVRVERRPEKN